MVKLVLEASDGFLSLAIFQDKNLIAEKNLECKRNLSEVLLQEIDKLLNSATISKKQINEIIVTRGPGSYTALRVVMAIAKTLSYALKIKIKTISTLLLQSKNNKETSKLSVSLIDGRRGNVYGAVYRNNDIVLEENYYELSYVIDYLNKLNEEVVFIGNSVNNFDYNGLDVNYEIIKEHPKAKNYILIEDTATEEDCYNAVPCYLRLTEAERNLENDKN